jgi:hypothetical protein
MLWLPHELWMERSMTYNARWVSIVALLVPLGVHAQSTDDSLICRQLVARNYAGIYIAYPKESQQWDLRLVQGGMRYDPTARFFFVPGYGPRLTVSQQEEGVWHVRTRTRSQQPRGTDTALVFRPSVTTRCSPNDLLSAFDNNSQFVTLRGYENYHADDPSRSPSTALHSNFHMRIKDRLSSEADGCTWTDDRAAFPHLARIYSFETDAASRVAANLDPISPVFAQPQTPASRYDGLSSEFAYDRREGEVQPACFGFTIALPTNGLARSWFDNAKLMSARQAGQSWNPVSTEIRIKRLRGRDVLTVKSMTVTWSR